jgi:hypothetical protein
VVGDRIRRGNDEWHVIGVSTDEHGHPVVTLGSTDGKAERSNA